MEYEYYDNNDHIPLTVLEYCNGKYTPPSTRKNGRRKGWIIWKNTMTMLHLYQPIFPIFQTILAFYSSFNWIFTYRKRWNKPFSRRIQNTFKVNIIVCCCEIRSSNEIEFGYWINGWGRLRYFFSIFNQYSTNYFLFRFVDNSWKLRKYLWCNQMDRTFALYKDSHGWCWIRRWTSSTDSRWWHNKWSQIIYMPSR